MHKTYNEFDNKEMYYIYRNIDDIINPSISKKNISNYRLILEEDLFPVKVFYPERLSTIKNVLFYFHGVGDISLIKKEYSSLCSDIAKKCDFLVIAIDYDDPRNINNNVSKSYNTLKYICNELDKNMNIYIGGDSYGGLLSLEIDKLIKDKAEFSVLGQILLYPLRNVNNSKVISLIDSHSEYNGDITSSYTLDNTLVFVGSMDVLKENIATELVGSDIHEINMAGHGFMSLSDSELRDEVYTRINKFK